MMFRSKDKGFTLIELLIVLVLIGLTTSFVLPNMWKQFDQAKYYSERKQLTSTVQFAKEYSIYKGGSLKLVVSESFLEIYELQEDTLQIEELETNTLLFSQLENEESNSKLIEAAETLDLLKRIDFSAFTLEPKSQIFNANSYFKTVTIKITAQGGSDSEKVEI